MPSRNVAEAQEPACAARASDRDSSSSSCPRVGVRRQGSGPGVPATPNGLVELGRQARPAGMPTRITWLCIPSGPVAFDAPLPKAPVSPNGAYAVSGGRFSRTASMPCAATRQAPTRSLPSSSRAHAGCRRYPAWPHRSARMRRCIRRGLQQLVGWRVVRQHGIGHLARCRSLFLVDNRLTELHALATVPPPRQPGDSCGPCRLDRAGPGSLLLLSRRAC